MWRRQNIGDVNPTIGKPLLFETTYDEDMLNHLPDVKDVGREQTHEVRSRLDHHVQSSLRPRLTQDDAKRISEVPTASSVYTGSPDADRDDFDSSNTVAPLFVARPRPQNSSAIPAPTAALSGHPPRRQLSCRTPLSAQPPTGPTIARAEDKVRPPGLGIVTSSSRDRMPWHGASGQLNVMTPIDDTPVSSYRSHSVSPVSDRRSRPDWRDRPGDLSPGPTISDLDEADFRPVPAIPWKSAERLVLTRKPRPREDSGYSDELDDAHRPQPAPVPLASPEQPVKSHFSWTTRADTDMPSTPQQSHRSPDNWPSTPPAKASTEQQPKSRFSWTTIATETQAALTPPRQTPRNPQREPKSHFSWTTRATEEPSSSPMTNPIYEWGSSPPVWSAKSAKHYDASSYGLYGGHRQLPDSPPTSPIPTPLSNLPVVERRRPVAGGDFPTTPVVKRKPTPSAISHAPTPSSTLKDLPPAPPSLDCVDLITSLDAELEGFAIRKRNLEKMIHNLTALQPQNPLVSDLRKRRDTKARVHALEMELADVRKKEHDAGLRLHKAWKRRDQEMPTALWIRRTAR